MDVLLLEKKMLTFVCIIDFANSLFLWTSLAAFQTVLKSCRKNTPKLLVILFPSNKALRSVHAIHFLDPIIFMTLFQLI